MAAGKARLTVREIIIVEGKYDKNMLSQAVDATILTTGGFSLFRDKKMRSLLVRLAKERGLIVLTDSDGAGMVIRNHIRSIVPPDTVKHAYIPPRPGKEPRKKHASKSGLLGVEGTDPDVLIEALLRAGATRQDSAVKTVTKQDLYERGLSGGVNSSIMRKKLQRELGLPDDLSSKALCEVLTALQLTDF